MTDQPQKTADKPEAEDEGFDLASLDTVAASSQGAEIELKHPTTGKGLGVFVTVLGKDSDVFRDIVNERRNNSIREAALNEKRGREPEIKTVEEINEGATDLLIACTVGWRTVTFEMKNGVRQAEKSSKPTMFFEGQWLPFTVPNARTLYTRLTWMRIQVDAAIGDLSLFIKP